LPGEASARPIFTLHVADVIIRVKYCRFVKGLEGWLFGYPKSGFPIYVDCRSNNSATH